MEERVKSTQSALKLLSDIEDSQKLVGLGLLDGILAGGDKFLFENGYDQLIFKELIRLVKFEDNLDVLEAALNIFESHYFKSSHFHDELAEELIYKVGRSRNFDVCKLSLKKISNLVDELGDATAKHSKQLLKLSDLNDMPSLDLEIREILEKMDKTLPARK